jgi:[ribosomal protein S18]-alanine N-acetyltransferase
LPLLIAELQSVDENKNHILAVNFSIRKFRSSDKYSVLELLKLNTPEYFAPQEEADLVYFLDTKADHYFVVEVNNRIVGSGGFTFSEDQDTGIICWDILHPQYKGRSIGTSLVKHRINKLKEFDHVRSIIVRTSQLAYKFYEKQGFKLIEIVEDYWAKGFDLYKMEYLP